MYCGKVHDTKIECNQKKKRLISKSKAGDLRNTYRWRKKREEIKIRDNYICMICKEELRKNLTKIKKKELHVHHIIPYKQDVSLFLEDTNLITLCTYHHELAEAGEIKKKTLRKLIL